MSAAHKTGKYQIPAPKGHHVKGFGEHHVPGTIMPEDDRVQHAAEIREVPPPPRNPAPQRSK